MENVKGLFGSYVRKDLMGLVGQSLSNTGQNSKSKENFITRTALRYWNVKYLVLLFIPGLVYFIIFKYIPMYGIIIAFKDYNFTAGIMGSKWVGLKQFDKLFASELFKNAFKNTIILSLMKLVIGFPAPIIFALLLNEIRALRFKKAIQTISYLPHFVSWVILAGIFVEFLSPTSGPVNMLLKAIGLDPVFFLGDTRWFRWTLVLTGVWKGIGWGSIIYLASLSSIDPTLYEAAEVDGASRWQRMWNITLPSIAPTITIMLILETGKLINDNFDQVFNLYSPAVYSVGDVIGTYVYRTGIKDMKYSLATAVDLIKNVINFALVILSNSIAKKISGEGIW